MEDRGLALFVDGHSLFHRAYFALPPLTGPAGQPTNAVYGFLTMLLRLLAERRPQYVAVALDRGTPTFRHETFERYKAHRPEMDDALRSQLPLLRRVLAALRIPVVEAEGYEADDVLGTLARLAKERGLAVVLVSGDRDLLQLVEPGVQAVLTRRGISELEVFDEKRVTAELGVTPTQLVDVKALQGDASDNIPGVPGIGEKTALRLIRRYGSVEELFRRLDEVGGKAAEALAAHREQVELARRLAAIVREVPGVTEETLAAAGRQAPAADEVRAVFAELGFRSLLKRVLPPGADGEASAGAAAEAGTAPPSGAAEGTAKPEGAVEAAEGCARHGGGGSPVRMGEEARRRLAALASLARRSALAVAYEPGVGIALGAPGGEEILLLAAAADGGLPDDGPLAELLGDETVTKVGHGLKPLARGCLRRGRRLAGPLWDTAVGAYLLDPGRTAYDLFDLCRRFSGEGEGAPALAADPAAASLAERAAAAARLLEPMRAEMEARGLGLLAREVEMPLVPVLAAMEEAGVRVDAAVLEELGGEFAARIGELEAEIHRLVGEAFNINSPQQLAHVLYERLGLPSGRRTKTGYSTDAAVLTELAAVHPVPRLVLEYRHLVKLQGTYVEGLRSLISPRDGRVHTTFHQTVTATGRLSSADPNLQNIPVREALGRRIRRAFVAEPGWVLVSADYSQIELRILAHMAGDEALIEAFRRGEDVHRATAARVFGVAPDQVTEEMRSAAKMVNFGIAYGISDYGLAQGLRIEQEEARGVIDSYFERFPGVRRYCRETIEQARRDGYVRTLFGRIRYLPDLHNRVPARRRFAERTAVNTPIQGTAADIIKMAMLRLARALAGQRLRTRLVLQVHDELMVEAPAEEAPLAARLLVDAMEGAASLAVPLVAEVKAGPNWYDLEPLAVDRAATDTGAAGGRRPAFAAPPSRGPQGGPGRREA